MTSPATSAAGNSGSLVSSIVSPAAFNSSAARSNAAFTSGSPAFEKSSGMRPALRRDSGLPAPGARRTGSSEAVGSPASGPAIAWRTSRQSAAERARGPTLSKVHEHTMAPARLTRP